MNAEIKTDTGVTARTWGWLKGFPKRHKVITTLAILYVIFKLITTPIVNPFASDVYTIRGRFPFNKGYELAFDQRVLGQAKWFRAWCGWPLSEEGNCYKGFEILKPTRIGENHYKLNVYRDRYFTGLQGWEHRISHIEYKSDAAIDLNRHSLRDYVGDESSVCDDSEEFLNKFKGKLFCTSQLTHKDFKVLSLTDGRPVQPNEELINFWLDSELTPMLEAHKQGAKP
jgi:hypothetical protein